MATTPLIKTPQADGGTFYTFSSSARDLSKTLNNDELKLVFSKFVLLNIPDFDKLDPNTFSNYENYMQFDTMLMVRRLTKLWAVTLAKTPQISKTHKKVNYI